MNAELRRLVRCKSCGESIIWCVTSTGKAIPINAQPVADGNVALFAAPDAGKVLALFGKALRDATERFTSHFATCPNAELHRRPRAKAAP